MNTLSLLLVSMVLTGFQSLLNVRACARSDSRGAFVWAEDPKMGLWGKKLILAGEGGRTVSLQWGVGKGLRNHRLSQ